MVHLLKRLQSIFQLLIAKYLDRVTCFVTNDVMRNELDWLVAWWWIVFQSVLKNLWLCVPRCHCLSHRYEHLFGEVDDQWGRTFQSCEFLVVFGFVRLLEKWKGNSLNGWLPLENERVEVTQHHVEVSLNDVFLESIVWSQVQLLHLEIDDWNEDFFPTVDQVKGQGSHA